MEFSDLVWWKVLALSSALVTAGVLVLLIPFDIAGMKIAVVFQGQWGDPWA